MPATLQWLPAAIMSLLCFGLWGYTSKLSVNSIDPKSALLFQAAGFAMVGIITLLLLKFRPETVTKGVAFAITSGLLSGIGCLFFFVATSKGKVSTVVTLTALYPIITIGLAYFLLKESISARQGVGILFALAAIYLLS